MAVGIGGRLWGGYVNLEANDDHVEVVQRLLNNQSIEHKDSCWECFQPPLFYKTNAAIAQITGKHSRSALFRQMQYENVVFSLLTILLAFLFLKHQGVSQSVNLLTTSFWLVNPALFSIGIQSTNDTLIILLGAGTVYFLVRYLSSKKLSFALWALLSLSIAPHFKGSGIAVFLLGTIVLIPILFYVKKHRYLLSVLAVSTYLLVTHSHYTSNYKKYENAFAINQKKTLKPPLFDDGQEFWKRPGITSVWSGYFKFQFRSLLTTPHNINWGDDYPAHRTSFWAQHYGSFYHAQFLNHPQSWRSTHAGLLNLTRITFILGLLPLGLLLIGLGAELVSFFREIRFDRKFLERLIHFGFLFGFICFNLKYSYDYRDFGCIKAIFILPAILSMTYFFVHGLTLPVWGRFRKFVLLSVAAVGVLCAANIVFLLVQLSKPYFAG
ncbi:MAG: glycosyltransferase family 39 protein [Bacteroidia bacterium]|nr:glycosyltransferase family 39 protein [Bacteroidia bacterium]